VPSNPSWEAAVVSIVRLDDALSQRGECDKNSSRKSPADQAGLFVGNCFEATHSCNAAFDQAIGAISGYTVFDQTVRTVSGNAVFDQTVRTVSGNAVFDQTVRTVSGNAVFDQTIRTPFSHTAFNQTIRAAFRDYRLRRGSGKSVNCKDRESDAEEGLAFHDGVLRGVYWLVWSGCYAEDFL
jgi:hypothetical protein